MASPQPIVDPQKDVSSVEILPLSSVTTTPGVHIDPDQTVAMDVPVPGVLQMPDQIDSADSKSNDSRSSSERESDSSSGSESGPESGYESDGNSSTIESDVDSTDEEGHKEAGLKGKSMDAEDCGSGEDDENGPSEMRTKNEVDEDNIPIARPDIPEVDANAELVPVGEITSVMDNKVVVMSNEALKAVNGELNRVNNNEDDMVAWDEGSLLVVNGRKVLGKIHETFGPVWGPAYLVRFNRMEEIKAIGDLKKGVKVWGVKDKMKKVRVGDIRTPGCDGSNIWDEEGGEQAFSDDEKERQATKRSSRGSGGGGKRTRLSRGARGSKSEGRNYQRGRHDSAQRRDQGGTNNSFGTEGGRRGRDGGMNSESKERNGAGAVQDAADRGGPSHHGRRISSINEGNFGQMNRPSYPPALSGRESRVARGVGGVLTHVTSPTQSFQGQAMPNRPYGPVQLLRPVPGFGQWMQGMPPPGHPQPMLGPMAGGRNGWNAPPRCTGMGVGPYQGQVTQQWYAMGYNAASNQLQYAQQLRRTTPGPAMFQSQYVQQRYDQSNSMTPRCQSPGTAQAFARPGSGPMDQTQFTRQTFSGPDSGGMHQPPVVNQEYTTPRREVSEEPLYPPQRYGTAGNMAMIQSQYISQQRIVLGTAPTSHTRNSYQGYVQPQSAATQNAQHSQQRYVTPVGPTMGQPSFIQGGYGTPGSSTMNQFQSTQSRYGNGTENGGEHERLNPHQPYHVGRVMQPSQMGHGGVANHRYPEYNGFGPSQGYMGNDGHRQG